MLVLIFLFLIGMIVLVIKKQELPGLLAVAGDEDMKIAGDSFAHPSFDGGEAEAKAYLEEKNSGNVKKARGLGYQYAMALKEKVSESLSDPAFKGQSAAAEHHKAVLYSYVINKVITEYSPNSILAQTALNVFYDKLEDETPILAEHIRDMAAYSLYILCERSETCGEDEIGKIYAQLCGEEDIQERIKEGSRCYKDFYNLCSQLHMQTNYIKG